MVRRVAALLIALSGSAHPATLCVNPMGSGGCYMTIQAAVDAAGRRDLIDVAAGTYVENVVIGANVAATIQGAGPAATIVDGNGSGPVFDLTARSSRLTVTSIGVQNGNPGIDVAEGARLTLSGCAVTGNVGLAGIFARNQSTVKVSGSMIAGNAGNAGITIGGGVPGTGRLTVASSTVSGNSGAGIGCAGKLTMTDSTVSGNSAFGGVHADSAIIQRSTI